ncbi:MAG: ribbon-helix-helix protein, CopG family [Microthrixaceae bacterium]|nr:ribbon-helix-helix protein, CopG family [Microthrixaceae bacterium]
MRTTLNLDDEVAAQLSHRAKREGRSMSRVANELIRDAIRSRRQNETEALAPYVPPVIDTGRPLMDVTDVAEVLDVLDGA